MRTVAFMVAISVGATGCAVAAARGPEPGPVRADHRPECNTGKGGVVADGLGATVLGISTLGLAAADEGEVARELIDAAGAVGPRAADEEHGGATVGPRTQGLRGRCGGAHWNGAQGRGRGPTVARATTNWIVHRASAPVA